MGLEVVSQQERIKEGEVFDELKLKNRAREKSVSLVVWGKWPVGTLTVGVRESVTKDGDGGPERLCVGGFG